VKSNSEQTMESNQGNGGPSMNPRPLTELRASLDFESESWEQTNLANFDGVDGCGPNSLTSFWEDALDQGRELSAYHRLAITPFQLNDLISVWHFASKWNQGRNIIIDCEVSGARVDDALGVLRTLHRRTVELVGKDSANGLLVLDDDALALYVASFDIEQLQMVRVEGPVDRGDIYAILNKATSGESVLEAELRASSSVEFQSNGPTILESRRIDMIAAALGADLAGYVASILQIARGDVPRPPQQEVMQLLARSGSILIRPADIAVSGGMIDIGICTDKAGEDSGIDTGLVFSPTDGIWKSSEAA
jgi:hypothetical protein